MSLWLVGFEDTMFIRMLRPAAIAFAVIMALFMMADTSKVEFDTFIIDNFEIF